MNGLIDPSGEDIKTERVTDRIDVRLKALKVEAEKTWEAMQREGVEQVKIRINKDMVISVWPDKEVE